MKKLFILWGLLGLGFCSWAQAEEDGSPQKKNTLYVQAGVLTWGQVGLSYERYAFSASQEKLQFYVRTSAGALASFGGGAGFGTVSLQALLGRGNSRLEGGLGIGVLVYDFDFQELGPIPSINLGYRFQKPQGGFLFRTGIGIPEGIYVSFGYAF